MDLFIGGFKLAQSEGFEPSRTSLEFVMLPLHQLCMAGLRGIEPLFAPGQGAVLAVRP